MALLLLALAVFALSVPPLLRRVTRVALNNVVALTFILLFLILATPQGYHAVDRWSGLAGLSRLLNQTFLILAFIPWLRTAALFPPFDDRTLFYRRVRSLLALLAVSDLAWFVVHSGLRGDMVYYIDFAGRPWPVAVMNLSIGAAYLWAVIGMIRPHLMVLRMRRLGADKVYLLSAIALWCSILPSPLIIIGATIGNILRVHPADLTGVMQVEGQVATTAGLLFTLSRMALSPRGRRFVLRVLEPGWARRTRDLRRAAVMLTTIRRDAVPGAAISSEEVPLRFAVERGTEGTR